MEHFVIRSCAYSQSEMFVVRDVWKHPPRSTADGQELLRVEWLTPKGWIPGVEGGNPPLCGPWELWTRLADALGVQT